jgi:hypothetical protein
MLLSLIFSTSFVLQQANADNNNRDCQEKLGKVSVNMETIRKKARLPLLGDCSFRGYDAASLMKDTAMLRKISLQKEERLKFLFHFAVLQIR